jgi:hypothetical protein
LLFARLGRRFLLGLTGRLDGGLALLGARAKHVADASTSLGRVLGSGGGGGLGRLRGGCGLGVNTWGGGSDATCVPLGSSGSDVTWIA